MVADHAAPLIHPDLSRSEQVRYLATGEGMLGTSLAYIENLAGHFAALGLGQPHRHALLEPGGPSDAGTAYLPAAIDGFPAQVRSRFDIVSWDPRGMGSRTTPVIQCFDSAADDAVFLESRLSLDLPHSPR